MSTLEELKYAINHVFFPRKLPTFGLEDEAIRTLDQTLLSRVVKCADRFGTLFSHHNGFSRITELLGRWEALDWPVEPGRLHQQLKSLRPGDIFAFYVMAQNATIIINCETDGSYLSAFQASRQTSEVMGGIGDLAASFPETTMRIGNDLLPGSSALANRLTILASSASPDVVPYSRKAGTEVQEEREVTDPKYIMEWLFAALDCDPDIRDEAFATIEKKIRDDVQWHKARLPFQRSGMWMSIKVVLATTFVHAFGENEGKLLYKAFLLHFLWRMCDEGLKQPLPSEAQYQMMGKVAGRMRKLKALLGTGGLATDIAEIVISHAARQVEESHQQLKGEWEAIVEKDGEGHSWGIDPATLNIEADSRQLLRNSWPHIVAALHGPAAPMDFPEYIPPGWKRFHRSQELRLYGIQWERCK
ncbi:hypothetical protein HDV00_001595 [Rhizophlyctis rosea]|nr:hypothetical protein HDV00_001595 [Rhizophlyctis rosea]